MIARRSAILGISAGLVGALSLWWGTVSAPSQAQSPFDVVVTGVSRPLQLVVDGRGLVVLSPPSRGDAAGEIYRIDVSGDGPVDVSRQPRVRIPFLDSRLAALGSLALSPSGRELFLGEENGSRIYRLGNDGRLALYAAGLQRLAGGGTLAFDRAGRLLILDYVDPRLSPSEERTPPGLEHFREEDYRGPLVFRLTLEPDIPLPRRLDRLPPLFPRVWGGREGGALLPNLVAVAPLDGDDVVVLTSAGELFRVRAGGTFVNFTRLPAGQYLRINMVSAPDGTIYVSGGFWVGSLFRVKPDGEVNRIATNLADPQGIALDARGDLYVAESSFHRIIRFRAASR